VSLILVLYGTSHLTASIPGHTGQWHRRSITHASAAVFALLGAELSNDFLFRGFFLSGSPSRGVSLAIVLEYTRGFVLPGASMSGGGYNCASRSTA